MNVQFWGYNLFFSCYTSHLLMSGVGGYHLSTSGYVDMSVATPEN